MSHRNLPITLMLVGSVGLLLVLTEIGHYCFVDYWTGDRARSLCVGILQTSHTNYITIIDGASGVEEQRDGASYECSQGLSCSLLSAFRPSYYTAQSRDLATKSIEFGLEKVHYAFEPAVLSNT